MNCIPGSKWLVGMPGKDYTKASAAVYRVRIQGFPHEDTLMGYNPLNAMYYEGIFGGYFGKARRT